ncbi:phosphotransferase enzyme family protein [Bradyrhizobium sp. Arg314]
MVNYELVVNELLPRDAGSIELISDGVNKILRLEDRNDDLFMRLSPTQLHSKAALQHEAALVRGAHTSGVPCCEMVEVGGQPVLGPVDIDGVEYHAVLTRAIAGHPAEPSIAHAAAFGKSLAKLHRANIATPERLSEPGSEQQVKPIFQPIMDELSEALDRIFPARQHPSSSGIRHGDARIGNAIMLDDTAILFDFEFIGMGDLAYDIATFLWCLVTEPKVETVSVFRSFVASYRQEHNILFAQDELRRAYLNKEMNNLYFLSNFIRIDRDTTLAAINYARDTISFVMSDRFDRYGWN